MKLKTREKGVSLIEILIAVAITAYIVMGFSRMFMQSNIALNHAKMQALAHNWAADKMEDIKSQYYLSISTETWSADTQVLGERNEFTRHVTVVEESPGLKEIEVKVTWKDLGRDNEVRVVSYIADY